MKEDEKERSILGELVGYERKLALLFHRIEYIDKSLSELEKIERMLELIGNTGFKLTVK